MNINQIKTFLTIVNTKSISKASEELFLSQPTVSHRLRSLEDEIGFTLIERKKGHKYIELTLRGEKFVSLAQRWMQLWQDMQQISVHEGTYQLTIGSVETLNTNIFSPLYKQLVKKDKDVLFDLKIMSGESKDIVHLAESRDIDIGLTFSKSVQAPNLIHEALFSEPLYIIKLCTDKNEQRTAYHPTELLTENELYFECSPTYAEWHDMWWNPTAKPYAVVDRESLLMEFLDDPDLWSIVPASVAQTHSTREDIKIYDILYPPASRVCYRVTSINDDPEHMQGIKIFNKYIEDYIREQSYVKAMI